MSGFSAATIGSAHIRWHIGSLHGPSIHPRVNAFHSTLAMRFDAEMTKMSVISREADAATHARMPDIREVGFKDIQKANENGNE